MPNSRKTKAPDVVETSAQEVPEPKALSDADQIGITISYLGSSLENLGREGIHPWNVMTAMAMVCGRAIPELLDAPRMQEALQQLHGRMITEMRNKIAQKALEAAKVAGVKHEA